MVEYIDMYVFIDYGSYDKCSDLFEDMPNDILSYQVEHRVVVYAAFYGYEGLGSGFGEEVRETAAIAKASSRSAK